MARDSRTIKTIGKDTIRNTIIIITKSSNVPGRLEKGLLFITTVCLLMHQGFYYIDESERSSANALAIPIMTKGQKHRQFFPVLRTGNKYRLKRNA
jgi:hypothetical protein